MQPLWSALDTVAGAHVQGGLLLGVSGGPDSRTLLETVARWPRAGDGLVEVAVVDHRTREASRAEAEGVVARAHALGLPGRVLPVFVDAFDEAALRDARLGALTGHARGRGLGAVVLGHHRGDVAEGRLLSLLGEGGGALRADSERDGIRILRPFLLLSRAQLGAARLGLNVHGVFSDPERISARARLRDGVLPHLPRPELIEARAAAEARRQADDDDTLLPMASALLSAHDDAAGRFVVERGPPALMRRALRGALKRLAPGLDVRASSPALDRVLELLGRGARGQIHLARGLVAVVEADRVLLTARALAGTSVPAYAPSGPPLETTETDDS